MNSGHMRRHEVLSDFTPTSFLSATEYGIPNKKLKLPPGNRTNNMKSILTYILLIFAVTWAAPVEAKLGETVPQLVKRFGKSYIIEHLQVGQAYRFKSANVSVDVIVRENKSICETYFSDHALTAAGEPPNDIVQGVLRTNVAGGKWIEIPAASLGADYAIRSIDFEYLATLNYTGSFPEGTVWTMTVQLEAHGDALRRARWSQVVVTETRFGLLSLSVEGFRFTPTTTVPLVEHQVYAWAVRVSTERSLSVREELELADGKTLTTAREIRPDYQGYIFGAWGVEAVDPEGNYVIRIFIDGNLATTFKFTVIRPNHTIMI
jgi:hypothetical protein